MTEKEHLTITVNPENAAWLEQNTRNKSGYIDDLLTQARKGTGSAEDVVRDYQIQQLEADIARKESETESMRDRLETLRTLREVDGADQEATLDGAVTALSPTKTLSSASMDEQLPDANSEAVRAWARKLQMEPGGLRAEVLRRLNDDG